MKHSKSEKKSNDWTMKYTVLIIILLILTIPSAIVLEQYLFNPITVESLISLLIPIFVIALFLERALEVFVSTWREMQCFPLNDKLKELKKQLSDEKAKAFHDGQPKLLESLTNEIDETQCEIKIFKAKTKRFSFLIGLCGGLIISMVGVRVLRPLTSMDADPTGLQGSLFNFVDIILTGALIGGGSDGVHKLMSVITDFLDSSRERIKKSTPTTEVSQ